MVLETRRTIVTHGEGQVVAIHQTPVGTAEERNQIVLGLVVVETLSALGACQRLVVVGLGIKTPVVVVLGAPVMSPFITDHDVEVVLGFILEIMIVLGVRRQREVTLHDGLPSVRAVVDSQGVAGIHICPLFTFRNVGTQSGVEAQVLETMYLIVELGTADERTADGAVVFQLKDGHRVLGGEVVVSIRPGAVVERGTGTLPLEVTAEIGGTRVIHALRGVVCHG